MGDDQLLKFSDEVEGMISAFSEGLHYRAYDSSVSGAVPVQVVCWI
jgi:hypothetical protein